MRQSVCKLFCRNVVGMSGVILVTTRRDIDLRMIKSRYGRCMRDRDRRAIRPRSYHVRLGRLDARRPLARSPRLAPRPGVPPAPRGRALPVPSRLTAGTGCRVAAGGSPLQTPQLGVGCSHRTTVLVLAREATYAALLALRLVPRLVLRRLFALALLALFAFPLLLVLATALLLRVVFLAT